MAELAIIAVTQLGVTLGEFLIQESTRPLKEVRSQVEWIQKELKYMEEFLQHLQRREGSSSDQLQLEDDIQAVAKEARDVLETFLIKSVKRRRKGVMYLFDKCRLGKEMQHITARMKKIFYRISKYEQTDRAADSVSVTIETPGVGVGAGAGAGAVATTKVALALQNLDQILAQNLITLDWVVKRVKHVRDGHLGDTQNIVSNLHSAEGWSERERVWWVEVKEICDYTVSVAENFLARKERQLRMGRLRQVLSTFVGYASELKFMKQMENISTQSGDALYRNLIFGDGGIDIGDRIRASISTPVLSLSLVWWISAKALFFILIFLFVPFVFVLILFALQLIISGLVRKPKKKNRSRQLTLFLVLDSVETMTFFLCYYLDLLWPLILFQCCLVLLPFIVWTVSLWLSLDQNLNTTRRYLVVMCALFSDIESAECLILNERQKVWVDQLRAMTRKGHSLVAEDPKRWFLFSRIRFAWYVKELLNEIIDISDRKNIYSIPNIQARKVLVSSCPASSIQGVNSEIIDEQRKENPPASSYSHITGLQLKFQVITCEKQLMDALFHDVREIGELDGRSKIWVNQMEVITRETEAIIHECASQLEHMQILTYILKYRTRHVIMGKINRIREKIKDATRTRKAYGLVQLQSRALSSSTTVQILRPRTQPSLIVKESKIVGFDEDAEVLIAQLLSDEKRRCIISIVGIEGTGKTTLARLIYNNEAVIECFQFRVWVSLSPSFTLQQFLEEIASQIMDAQQERWTTKDQTLVFETLASTKYLIIVDGMQTCLFLDKLREAIPDMSTTSRFLLTTRNANVARQAGTRSFVHSLQLLDDEQSWTLFTRNLSDFPSELTDVGKKIVTKCGGLPLEILKKCELLSRIDAREEQWLSVQEQPNQEQNPWSETLNTVNMNLPSYLRRCLFYFGLFPADFGIPTRRLVALWVAEDLVPSREDQEPPELIVERYLTELIDRNMVQVAKRKPNGKVKICRLPNAFREFLLNAAPKNSRIHQVVDCLDEKDIWHKHIHGNTTSDSASLRTYYKNVFSFLSFDAREGSKPGQDTSNFLNLCISCNCLLLLRVLDLEGVYKPKLPKSIARLTRLRYLGLRRTCLESLPSCISTLLKLQTLDLKHTYIHTLTSSIWHMELRHLFLSETYRTRFPPKPKGIGIGTSLSDLQTLWGLYVDQETPVKGYLDKSVKIRKLGVACQSMSLEQEAMEPQLDAVADWIVKQEFLQSLRLKSRDEKGRPWNLHLNSLKHLINLTDMYLLGCLTNPSILSEFPPNLVELTLSHSKLEQDPMQILKDLPNLRSLSLLAESYTGNALVCNSQSFPQLCVLKVWKLEQLEEWNIEQQAFPSLRQLEIRSCRRMKILPNGLELVNTLLELKLTNMSVEIDKNYIPPHCEVHIDNFE